MKQYPFVNVNYENFIEASDDRVKLQMEVILKYESLFQKSDSAMPSICLRIGDSRLYYVFDYKKFFESLDGNGDYSFGSNFKFNSDSYYFGNVDLEIIQIIRELYEIDSIFMHQRRGHSAYLPDGIIEDKWVFLPDAYIERLFLILQNKEFKIEFQGIGVKDTLYIDTIENDFNAYEFNLSLTDKGYELGFNFTLFKLTHTLSYVIYNGYVCKLNSNTIKGLAPLFDGLYGNNPLRIALDKQDHFISQVVPYIKNFASLTLDEALESSIIEAPLHAEVYLDKKGQYIFATVDFYYLDHKIDPFHSDTNEGRPIIFRDHNKEDLIVACFSDFVIKSEGLFLYDEDKSYDFLTESLPLLFDLTDVFYTDSFKAIKINTAPTIKSKVSYLPSENFLEFSFEVDSVGKDELHQLFNAIKLKKKYYRMQNGSYVGINNNNLESFSSLVDRLQLNYSDLSKDTIRLPAYRSFLIDDFSKNNNDFKLKRRDSFKTLIDSIQSPDEHDFVCPAVLEPILRDYQFIGFKWLKTLAKFGFGGILADDMGLGKTIQTIAFIISEYETSPLPTLIIAPTSLVYNWEEEIHKFLPDFEVLIVDGNPSQREALISTSKSFPIVITSYPLIRRDITSYEAIQFNYCIIDEAQHIKNPKSLNAQSVKKIHANGYFALTGTPIENHLTELWSIFDFVMPQLLFSHTKFTNLYEAPITKENNKNALNQLKKSIRPFILRRLKTEVLKELPDKIETKLIAPLSDDQKKLYLAYLEEAKATVNNEIKANTFKKNQLKILSMITRLRQICCHPGMFIDDYTGASGKLDLLLELIEDSIEGGHKILLFSQYTSMLNIIREELIKMDIKYAYLDGKVPSKRRKDIIHKFNHGDLPIFLISLKAGGTGLNLTTADVVIHFDPWWNPAVEDQATDRAYRIGQEKNVQVFKLIAKGTIEEKIFNLQKKKKALANSIIESGESFITSMSSDDIRELLDI